MADKKESAERAVGINDAAIKAAVNKAAADLKLSPTSGKVCLLATLRLLMDYGWEDREAIANAFLDFSENGHGLGCNASQLGQFVQGKGAAKVSKSAADVAALFAD